MMRAKFLICEICRPVVRRLPFARIRLLHYLGAGDQHDKDWQQHPSRLRVFYDPDLQAYIWADLGDWGGRWHYFSGRYYDLINQSLMRQCLRAGDTYIDIGANYGIHSIAASRVVGPQGTVISIEPNPPTFEILRAHVNINRLGNVRLFNVGLSDQPGELTLRGADHPGTYTFRENPEEDGKSVKVPVHRGDDILRDVPLTGKVLVKIDTEGFEHRALRGLPELRKRPNVAFSIEVTDSWLKQTGSSAKELFQDMLGDGFEAYEMTTNPTDRTGLILLPTKEPRDNQYDVVFAKPGYLKP